MFSLIIPSTSKNIKYVDFLVNNIRSFYPDENKVEIVVEINDNVNLSTNYNNAVSRAKGDKIILLHNDMVISKDFLEIMEEHIQKGRITTYTRVEPPIFNDLCPGKIIQDYGTDIESFNEDFFSQIYLKTLIDGGSQLFFGCLKEDYIGLDGDTFQMFCEDDDIHLRYKIAGYEHKVSSAHVYHFVSKTSRTIEEHDRIENLSNEAFIKKWGFRNSIHNKVYNKAVIFKGKSSPNSERIIRLLFNSSVEQADVVAEIDFNTFNKMDFYNLENINDIVFENNEIGEFEMGNIKLYIKSLKSHEQDLIFINK